MFVLIFYAHVHVRIHTRFWKGKKNALISALLYLKVVHGHSESQTRSEVALAVFASFLLPFSCVLAALPVSKSDDDDGVDGDDDQLTFLSAPLQKKRQWVFAPPCILKKKCSPVFFLLVFHKHLTIT